MQARSTPVSCMAEFVYEWANHVMNCACTSLHYTKLLNYTITMQHNKSVSAMLCSYLPGVHSVHAENEKQIILDGMRHWEDKTCIRFKQKQAQDFNFIHFYPGSWCVVL